MTEIQKEEFEMFKKIIPFLEKNNISYFVCGGTLLGAIRHKGFIPWDDDIDIAMPRNDYEKLISMGKNNPNIISSELEIQSIEINGIAKPYAKIINKDIRIKAEYGIDKYLWIDIFPFDGLPEDEKETRKIYKKCHFYKRLIGLKDADNTATNKIKYYLKEIRRFCLKVVKSQTIAYKIINIAKKYNYNTSKYVGGVVWGYGPQEKIERKNFDIIPVEFEGIMVNGIVGYDKYLTNLYGNYMQLPPVEKRLIHYIEIIK